MKIRKMTMPALMVAVLTGVTLTPALAQNRFMDQAKEAADRREEHKAIREAEHPEALPATQAASQAAPATQAAQAGPASGEQSAPAAPEAPAPAAPQ